jgi:hypothetical protein
VTCSEAGEAETSVGNREAMDALVSSLEETSKGEDDSDAWRVPLGSTL